MGDRELLEWLLEEEQPSIRLLALTQLLDRPEDDPEVEGTRALISKKGWVADILARQHPEGWWASGESFYVPKYVSTNWMLLILSDLGLTREEPRIERTCDQWIERFATPDGGFDEGEPKGHLCITGNTARALVRFGYVDHPRVRSAFEWLVKHQNEDGGWDCFESDSNLDSWEGLSAFAVYPRQQWSASMKRAVEKGAEFYLQRELHKEGDRYEPWYRFHYPIHYYYDLLVGLDFMTALGYGDDPRMRYAISLLREKRRPNGRWNLDAVHPDVLEGKIQEWYGRNPEHWPTPFALERAGEPSKMVTLTSLRVLRRVEEEA